MIVELHLKTMNRPPLSFNTAFERLKDSVTRDDARSFSSSTIKDVWDSIKDIEKELEKRRSLCGFRRIEPLLTGIEQYAKVVEVFCQGTPYLPWIWVRIPTNQLSDI